MRNGDQRRGVRASALWGSGKRGTGSRSNALWGSGKRRRAVLATLALVVLVPLGASASPSKADAPTAFVTPSLLSSAQSDATGDFDVIVQGKGGNQAAKALADVLGTDKKAYKDFRSIDGIAAHLSGAQIVALASDKHITAITPDARVRLSAASSSLASNEKWPYVTGGDKYNGAPAATIAVVDSGIDATRPEFAGRIVANVNLSTLPGNSAGDGRGHGTFVAGIAAGKLSGKDGAAPTAKLVSIDVMDDQGMARTSDVIAAADWILANKAQYGIKVANFSLHSSVANSFMYDPLDKAVEKLWFNGVVVVAAAGNYGENGQPTTGAYAPGNDPFVISVGASDTNNTGWTANDDTAAPWSAFGYTLDGFAKPDLGAPGRYMIGPVPALSTMALEHPERMTAPSYMWMSGTSFAAPVVSGAAALILAKNPNWTPDKVKGALMLTARATNAGVALGVGEVNAKAASDVTGPPNPNAGLNQFVTSDGTGGVAFDSASWASTAQTNASWNAASWASASWANASWSSASWNAASWAQASWAQASWASASWNAASWAQASWAAASWNAASWAQASWAE